MQPEKKAVQLLNDQNAVLGQYCMFAVRGQVAVFLNDGKTAFGLNRGNLLETRIIDQIAEHGVIRQRQFGISFENPFKSGFCRQSGLKACIPGIEPAAQFGFLRKLSDLLQLVIDKTEVTLSLILLFIALCIIVVHHAALNALF